MHDDAGMLLRRGEGAVIFFSKSPQAKRFESNNKAERTPAQTQKQTSNSYDCTRKTDILFVCERNNEMRERERHTKHEGRDFFSSITRFWGEWERKEREWGDKLKRERENDEKKNDNSSNSNSGRSNSNNNNNNDDDDFSALI